MRKQTRCQALKLPIAGDPKTATFAYLDPGKETDTELRSWARSTAFKAGSPRAARHPARQ